MRDYKVNSLRMFHNVSQHNAEQIVKINRTHNQPFKSINNQFLQIISAIRALEDQLLAQQYKYELMIEQNNKYKSALHTIQNNHQMQHDRIKDLEAQINHHINKNSDLQQCQESLRAIYSEIQQLTHAIELRSHQCEQIKAQIEQVSMENNELKNANRQMSEKHLVLSDQLIKRGNFSDGLSSSRRMMPILMCKQEIMLCKQQMQRCQWQEGVLRRQRALLVGNQKQLIMRLQYECSLEQQRNMDSNKIQDFAKICKNEENLQSMIEQMLAKEDELHQELSQLHQEYHQLQAEYQAQQESLRQKEEEEVERGQREVREQKMRSERLGNEMRQQQKILQMRKQSLKAIIMQQQLSFKVNVNLSVLKRFREAVEGNKHLKLNISGLQEIKVLLLQQKQLFHSR